MKIELTDDEVTRLRALYDAAHLKPEIYWDLFVNKAVTILKEKGVLKSE